ncbi:unnamed protein product [Caenorhabditis auriculariae]|uniref:Gamma tubulin complex component protein N-terminal domain-containing protein n=1 Tax=Caenorhabditis auriculariae TaxID=2777116 RepID=A0A8S1GR87_9PELO|nr:unnamed protein product [Caenorhabditis auriculariae]
MADFVKNEDEKRFWRTVRKKHLSKWKSVLVNDLDNCPFYREIPSSFVAIENVSPQEQERLIFNEMYLFLLGYQSENIRLASFNSTSFPTSIVLNHSLDPFIRSELERFKHVLISLAVIRLACYRIQNDGVCFSVISRAVATEIDTKIHEFMNEILRKLDENKESAMVLNLLFREVHEISETLMFFSDIAKKIYNEQLVGGQVLSMLHLKRNQIYAGRSQKHLEELFEVGWRIFVEYMGRLVTSFEADDCNYEFAMWSNRSIDSSEFSRLNMHSEYRTRSSRFVIIDDLCPSFLHKHLKVFLRCAEFGDLFALAESQKRRKQRRTPGDVDKVLELEKPSHEALLATFREVEWNKLNVDATFRLLAQLERKGSACLLQQLRQANNVDADLREAHQLVLFGKCIEDLLQISVSDELLDLLVDEVSKHTLQKLTNKLLGEGAAQALPFWKNFSFVLDREDVFKIVCDSNVQLKGYRETMDYGREEDLCFFTALSLSFRCPPELETLLAPRAIENAIYVFRLLFQFSVASHKIALGKESLRGRMPSQGGDSDGTALRRKLLFSLDAALTRLKRHFSVYTQYALQMFNSSLASASSIDEYIAAQNSLSYNVLRMVGMNEWSRLIYMKDLLSIVRRYDEGNESLVLLAADFEDLLSTAMVDVPE